MFLSIIIPTYNDEKYLDECLGSCLAQDIDDYEIICVDDGSTDRTPQMLDEYAAKYPRISVIHKEHGVGYGRNIGMEHAKGEYLWFVDHDDLVAENCLGFFRSKVLETGCERLAFYYYQFSSALTDEERRLLREQKLKANGIDRIDFVVWTSITKRAFLLEHDIYPHSKRLGDRPVSYGVDAFYVRECKEANIKSTLLTDKPYYFYRKYLGQSVNDYSEKAVHSRISSMIGFAQMFREEYQNDTSCNGAPSFSRAMDHVVSIRGCAQGLLLFQRKYRKMGFDRLRSEGLFPFTLPKIYTDHYSCWDCIRAKNGMGPLKSIAFYYSVNPVGLFFFRVLDTQTWLRKLRNTSASFRKIILRVLSFKNKCKK